MQNTQILLHSITKSTNQIYAFIGNRIYYPPTDITSRNHHVEQCYEYFYSRLNTAFNYFYTKIYTPNSGQVVRQFKAYLYRYFLKNLIVDYNRKTIRAYNRQLKKEKLYYAFLQNQFLFTQSQISILTLYFDSHQSQSDFAKSQNISRYKLNRLLKKLK